MPSVISKLQIFAHEDDRWVWADILVKTLRKNLCQRDKLQAIKCSNVMREFHKHPHGVKQIGEKCALRLFCVLRYIFHHAEDMNICKRIAKEIEHLLTFQECNNDVESVLSLYKKVSSSSFWSSSAAKHLLESDFQTCASNTLYSDHKQHFSNDQWNKICIFESQFEYLISPSAELDFHEHLRKKWDFYHLCEDAAKIGKCLTSMNATVINNRIQRRLEAEKAKEVLIYAETEHILHVVESDLHKLTNLMFPHFISRLVVVDNPLSVPQNAFNLYVELSEDTHVTGIPFEDIANCLARTLANNHQTNCRNVFYFIPNSLAKYERPNGKFARFHMQDDVTENLLGDKIINVQNVSPLYDGQENAICSKCFQTKNVEPLQLSKKVVQDNFVLFRLHYKDYLKIVQ